MAAPNRRRGGFGKVKVCSLRVCPARAILVSLLCLVPKALPSAASPGAPFPRFQVSIAPGLAVAPKDGRLFVILSPTNNLEPRFTLGKTGLDAPQVLARDLLAFAPGTSAALDETAFTFPASNHASRFTPPFFAQALFACNPDLNLRAAPGNLYSPVQKLQLDAARGGTVKIELTQEIPPEPLPADTAQIKFIKIQSKLLSQFHGRPIFLRAGIVLPRDYERDSARHYPLWVRVGGLNARFSAVNRLMAKDSDFRKTWLAEDTPRFILLLLDGAGPYGDPYQVNSANNGPYGDALVQELIPFVETKFRAAGQARARVLSGTSTGGWVALALQIFYPDLFNGAWSACPDPVDFRALELLNIYEDVNAYVNRHGQERPSARNAKGDVTLTMRREVQVENLLGRGNSFTMSGEQWGAWNAAFGPRGGDGRPVPLWDPQTGEMNHTVAAHWKKYDLRLVLEQNWPALGPRLRGKLHISSGEADQYFLNNAVHLLDEFMAKATPAFEGKIVFGPGKGHGWTDLSLRQMLAEMEAATERR